MIAVISLSMPVYAEDVFMDKDIRELQLIRVSMEEAKAWIQDADGMQTEVVTGDAIGTEKAVIMEIRPAYIAVQSGTTKTKIPVTYGFE